MGLGHIEFDVIDLDFRVCQRGRYAKVTVDGFYGGEVAVLAGGCAYAVFERILGGDYEIDHIETGLLDHVLDDGEVADMQRIE